MFGAWGNPDHDDSIRIIHRALDAGINFIDTADVYSEGESEVIVGKALARWTAREVVLATKVHAPMGDDPNAQGNSRRWIIAECENSLRRLGTDYIDLYQIHRPTKPSTWTRPSARSRPRPRGQDPVLRQLHVPGRTDRRGPVGGRTPRARTVHDRAAALFHPGAGHRADVLPVAQSYGMGVIPWSPLAGGWLSGRFGRGQGEHEPASGSGFRAATT